MANGCCTNAVCADRETQLRLARLREELLTNFNTLLLDRIRFLEQTINQLSLPLSSSSSAPQATTSASASARPISVPSPKDRTSTPSPLRRSSSTTAYFLQSPVNQNFSGNGEGARSCPSSVDLSASNDRRRRFFSSKKFAHSQNRASTESHHSNYLSIPMDAPWPTFTNDLASNTNNERGRLETRRFACDVDDNEVRAFKAMVYMEQARKQHARPLTRLRQALGISTNSNPSSYVLNNLKKHSNA